VRDRDRLDLEGLERDLLCEHDIANRQVFIWHEAQEAHPPLGPIEQLDIQYLTMPDAIPPATVATNNLEISEAIVLRPLRGREVLGQQPQAAGLRGTPIKGSGSRRQRHACVALAKTPLHCLRKPPHGADMGRATAPSRLHGSVPAPSQWQRRLGSGARAALKPVANP
jgi:hypothetical protein